MIQETFSYHSNGLSLILFYEQLILLDKSTNGFNENISTCFMKIQNNVKQIDHHKHKQCGSSFPLLHIERGKPESKNSPCRLLLIPTLKPLFILEELFIQVILWSPIPIPTPYFSYLTYFFSSTELPIPSPSIHFVLSIRCNNQN